MLYQIYNHQAWGDYKSVIALVGMLYPHKPPPQKVLYLLTIYTSYITYKLYNLIKATIHKTTCQSFGVYKQNVETGVHCCRQQATSNIHGTTLLPATSCFVYGGLLAMIIATAAYYSLFF